MTVATEASPRIARKLTASLTTLANCVAAMDAIDLQEPTTDGIEYRRWEASIERAARREDEARDRLARLVRGVAGEPPCAVIVDGYIVALMVDHDPNDEQLFLVAVDRVVTLD